MMVPKAAYVTAKTKQLRGFGYADLSEAAVLNQLELVLLGKTLKTGLDVIGGFMIDEIILPEAPALPPMTKQELKGKTRLEARRRLKKS